MITIVLLSIIGFLCYYIALPAVNIHSSGFWWFLLGALVVATIITGFISYLDQNGKFQSRKTVSRLFFIIIGSITGVMLVIFIIGGILSSPIVNAKKYQKLLLHTFPPSTATEHIPFYHPCDLESFSLDLSFLASPHLLKNHCSLLMVLS